MRKLACFSLAFVFLAATVHAADLPSPPSGFAWQQIPEVKSALLRPEGWYFKQEEKGGILGYFVTEQDINKAGHFETGLTVNVFPRLGEGLAVERGKALIDRVAGAHGEKTWSQQVGQLQEFGCEVRDTDASGTVVMHALAVANTKTDTLYLLIFESPAGDWDTSWKIGKEMMDAVKFDDGI
jgi:hypothetical protein